MTSPHPATLDREKEVVALAISTAWKALRDVPFPLYDSEAEGLAAAAIAALDKARTR